MEIAMLSEYVRSHSIRGACCCGRCVDAPTEPEEHQPNGHTADVYFFKVSAESTARHEDLIEEIKQHRGEFVECDPLDGKEHSFIELGGWIGDQGMALMLMGLGNILGLWNLMTPNMLPGLPKDLADIMAGQGMVTIQAKAPV
jgi:hypothetical protein